MQFYRLSEDPGINVCLLPEYALKVNVREGWQILSDIGHIYGITWKNQNKCYSKSHPTTRFHARDWEAIKSFLEHYRYCLRYIGMHGKVKSTPCAKKAMETMFSDTWIEIEFQFMDKAPKRSGQDPYGDISYLLTEKVGKLSECEKDVLKKWLGNGEV